MYQKLSYKAMVSGRIATACQPAAEALYELGGKDLLSEQAKNLVRDAAISVGNLGMQQAGKETAQAVTAEALKQGAKVAGKQGTRMAVKEGAKAAGKQGARMAVKEGAKAAGKAAGSEILKRIGGAAGMGAAIDGAFATAEAIYGYSTGALTGPKAAKHVAVEAGTGALATAAGVGVAAATVILTGGLAAPAMFVLGAGTTIIAKLGFKKLLGS